MEESMFNIISKVPDESIWLLFNTFTGSFTKINGEDNYKNIDILFNQIGNFSKEDPEKYKLFIDKNHKFIEQFKSNGFLVESKQEEFSNLFYKRNSNKYNCENNHFEIYLVPTLNCNFKCPYCFATKESIADNELSLDLENKIISYIKKKCKNKIHLKINWFGGEPLLKLDQIERILTKLHHLLGNITIDNMLFTNGYNLSKSAITRLNKLDINNILFTFHTDYILSNPEIYKTIEQNLKLINSQYQGNLMFRIMVSNENNKKIIPLIDHLLSEKILIRKNKKVKIEIKPINDENGRYISNSDSKQFSYEEFSKIESEIDLFLCNKGLINDYIIRRDATFCGMHSKNVVGITSGGDFFRCTEEVGSPKSALRYGSITDDMENSEIENQTYKSISQWEVPQSCKDCKILPMCFGGCVKHAVNDSINCRPEKYNIKQKMIIRYEVMQQNSINKEI